MIRFTLLFCTLLTACASTPSNLKENAAGRYSFTADNGYQSIYRTVVTKARECYQTGLITAQMLVQSDLFTDIKAAQVNVALHGGLGVTTYLTIEIKAITEDSSRIDVYYAPSTWKRSAQAVRAWVLDSATDCGAIPKT